MTQPIFILTPGEALLVQFELREALRYFDQCVSKETPDEIAARAEWRDDAIDLHNRLQRFTGIGKAAV